MKPSPENNKLYQRRRRQRFYAQGLDGNGHPRRRDNPAYHSPVQPEPEMSEQERLWRAFRSTIRPQPEAAQ